jgi:hypothetical protein
MEAFRQLVQRGLRGVDSRYHRAHRLQPAGPILYVGREKYSGPTIQFVDDTLLEIGDDVGTLHFNNLRFAQMEADSATGAALGFARLIIQSLRALADKARTDPAFSDLAVYHAVSWLPGHGDKIGFITAPYPGGMKKRLMAAHFRLLIWAFAPIEQSRKARPDPHFYWLTRKELLRRYGGARGARDAGDGNTTHVSARYR